MEPQFEVLPPGGRVPQQRPSAPEGGKKRGIVGAAAAVLVVLAKFKFLALGILKTSLSMFISIWLYAQFFGWPFAAGIVFLILVHEMGHFAAAKWLGIPVSAPLFIPFFGAAIVMKENPRDAWTEALMAYAGPLAGCIGSFIFGASGFLMGERWMMAVALFSFGINLFNMISVPPLDGGRICAAVSPRFWFLGLALLGAYIFYFHRWGSIGIVILVLIWAIPRFKEFFGPTPSAELQRYYQIPLARRFLMGAMYLALLGALGLGYWGTSSLLHAMMQA